MQIIPQILPYLTTLTVLHFTFNQCHFLLSAFIPPLVSAICLPPHSPKVKHFSAVREKQLPSVRPKVLLKWRYHFTEENSICSQLDIGNVFFHKMSDLYTFLVTSIKTDPLLRCFSLARTKKRHVTI